MLLQDTSCKTHTLTSNTPIEFNSHRNPASPSGRVNPEVSPRYRSDESIAHYDISVVVTSKYLNKSQQENRLSSENDQMSDQLKST